MNQLLYSKLAQQIDRLELQLRELQIDAEAFGGWFDPQLFNQDVDHPLDYVQELRRGLTQLQQTTTSNRSHWLSERIAHQLAALHQAIAWYKQQQTNV